MGSAEVLRGWPGFVLAGKAWLVSATRNLHKSDVINSVGAYAPIDKSTRAFARTDGGRTG